jgi:putative peptidoglycan lipid II flippase
MFYAPGLLGYSAVKIASPSFYVLRDSRTPVAVSVMSVLLNMGLNLTLVRVLGYRGLALGTALAALANATVLLWLLRRRFGGIDGRRVAIASAKIAAASAVMATVAHWGHAALAASLPGGFAGRALALGLAIGMAMAALGLAARLLRLEEFDQAMGRVIARIRPRPAADRPDAL